MTRQARFTIKNREAFDAGAIKTAISKAGYPRAQVLKGPTEK